MKQIVVKEEWYEDNKLQREINLESGVENVYMLTSDHLDGKDVISFRRRDIPSIIKALKSLKQE